MRCDHTPLNLVEPPSRSGVKAVCRPSTITFGFVVLINFLPPYFTGRRPLRTRLWTAADRPTGRRPRLAARAAHPQSLLLFGTTDKAVLSVVLPGADTHLQCDAHHRRDRGHRRRRQHSGLMYQQCLTGHAQQFPGQVLRLAGRRPVLGRRRSTCCVQPRRARSLPFDFLASPCAGALVTFSSSRTRNSRRRQAEPPQHPPADRSAGSNPRPGRCPLPPNPCVQRCSCDLSPRQPKAAEHVLSLPERHQPDRLRAVLRRHWCSAAQPSWLPPTATSQSSAQPSPRCDADDWTKPSTPAATSSTQPASVERTRGVRLHAEVRDHVIIGASATGVSPTPERHRRDPPPPACGARGGLRRLARTALRDSLRLIALPADSVPLNRTSIRPTTLSTPTRITRERCRVGQAALNWVLVKAGFTATVIGATEPRQLQDSSQTMR